MNDLPESIRWRVDAVNKTLSEMGFVLDETPIFAPSEEYTIHCDICGCGATVAMVGEVARADHDWGRVSVYAGESGTTDYDLCPEHFRAVKEVLKHG